MCGISKRRSIIKLITYVALLLVYMFIVGRKMYKLSILGNKVANFEYAEYCVSDMMGIVYNDSVFALMLISGIIVIYELRAYFRSDIIIQYKSRLNVLKCMYVQSVKYATIIIICATATSTLLAMYYADVCDCNWAELNSYLYIRYGGCGKVADFPTWTVILIFGLAQWLILVVESFVIVFGWFVFSPIVGVIIVIVAYVLETATTSPPYRLLFSYTELDTDNIYLNGFDAIRFMFPAFGLGVIIVVITMIYIRRKNLIYK